MRETMLRTAFFLLLVLAFVALLDSKGHAQTLKKVRMASSSTNVAFLALYTALHRGFFKDEGIDLEIIGSWQIFVKSVSNRQCIGPACA